MTASRFTQNSAEERENALKLNSNNTYKVSKGTVKILFLNGKNENFEKSACVKLDESPVYYEIDQPDIFS